MRAFVAASLVLGRLICVAYCSRLPERQSLSDNGFAAAAPRNAVAPLDAGANPPRRLKWRQLSKLGGALKLLAGVSPWARFAAASSGGGGREGHEAPSAWPGIELARSEDAPLSDGRRQGRVLHVALAIRGGETVQHDKEHEPSEAASTNPATVSLNEIWFSDEKAIHESEVLLLGGAWRTTIAEPVSQIWHFEFVLKDGLYADISCYHLPQPNTKVGSDLVKLSPVMVSERFLGFAASGGSFRYRFSHVGEDLRIDIIHVGDEGAGDGDDVRALFASPVARGEAWTSQALLPTQEFQDQLRHNLERLLRDAPEDPRETAFFRPTRELISLFQLPGHWSGTSTDHPVSGKTFDWMFIFTFDQNILYCAAMSRNSKGDFRVDGVYLSPYYIDGEFAGLGGRSSAPLQSATIVGGVTEYMFTVHEGRLRVEVAYTIGGETLRLYAFLSRAMEV